MSFTRPGMEAPPRARSTSGLAVTTLFVGIAGFLVITIPLNLVLGIAALVRIARTGDRGRGLAVTGLVLTVLWGTGIAIGVVALLSSPDPKRDASGNITAPQAAGPDKLRVGDCVARTQASEVTDVRAEPCGRPNSDKVFAIFNLPSGPWPGQASSNDTAQKGCAKRFAAAHKNTDAELSYFGPTATRWKLGYHRVVCLFGPPS